MRKITHKVIIEIYVSEPDLESQQIRERWIGKLSMIKDNWDVEDVTVEMV